MKLHKNCNHEKLISYGFKKYGSIYRLSLPVYKYKKHVVVECDFEIDLSNNTFSYDVFDNNTQSSYIPYYDTSYSTFKNNIVYKKISKLVDKELKKMIGEKIIAE